MVAIAMTYLCGFGDAARMRGLSIVLLLPWGSHFLGS